MREVELDGLEQYEAWMEWCEEQRAEAADPGEPSNTNVDGVWVFEPEPEPDVTSDVT